MGLPYRLFMNLSVMSYKVWDEVRHPVLGDGYIEKIISNERGVPTWLSVEWDEDPSEDYNMATNPCLVLISEIEKI